MYTTRILTILYLLIQLSSSYTSTSCYSLGGRIRMTGHQFSVRHSVKRTPVSHDFYNQPLSWTAADRIDESRPVDSDLSLSSPKSASGDAITTTSAALNSKANLNGPDRSSGSIRTKIPARHRSGVRRAHKDHTWHRRRMEGAESGVKKRAIHTSSNAMTGDATYYATGLGACGKISSDQSLIAAASHLLFDNFPGATEDPNSNPICGRKVKATYKGASVIVEIVDRCTGCAEYDLDFSPAAFAKIGSPEEGRLHGMTWQWV